jgi:photosystem II stability/assembly factor-like uncharacterized protein
MAKNDLENLYKQAQQAIQTKDFDRATDLLTQILVVDENYKDTSRLLARIVKEKRRRWYNDPRNWGSLLALIIVALLIWLVPKFRFKALFGSATNIIGTPSITISTKSATSMIPATSIPTYAPTAVPLAWNRISMSQEFATDTVTGIAVDKNDLDVIFVGMKNAGVFKSIDGGLSWSPQYQGLANTHVESLIMDPDNSKILYTATMGGIFKTQNGGESWQKTGEGYRLLMDPKNSSHLYADSGGGEVFESTDQGDSWVSHRIACPGFYDWAIDPQNGMILYGSDNGDNAPCKMGLYKSTDGARTWNFLGLGDQPHIHMAISVDEQGNDLIYAGGVENFVSNDGGKNWNILQTPGCHQFLPVQSDSPDTVYCADTMSNLVIYKAGKSPQSFTLNKASILEIDTVFADSYHGTPRLIAGAQGLYISMDNGQSWSNRSGGLGAARLELKMDPTNDQMMFLASYFGADEQDCILFRSDDSGKSWKKILQGGHVSWCGPAFDSIDTIYLLEEDNLSSSTDHGETWTSSSLPSGLRFFSISANPYMAGHIYAGSNELYYSTDNGSSWQKAINNSSSFNNSRFYYAKEGTLIFSNKESFSADGGKSWNSCSGMGNGSRLSDSGLVIDPDNNKSLYLATDGNGIMISVDLCQTWYPRNSGLGNLFVNSIALNPNNRSTVFAGTNGGVYISYDQGQTWGQINNGLLGVLTVYSIAIDSQSNVYAATPYGIFKLGNK